MEVGEEGEYIYLSLHCHHQNDFCIKMDSDESHFNVSLIEGQSHKTVSTNHKRAAPPRPLSPCLTNRSQNSPFVH